MTDAIATVDAPAVDLSGFPSLSEALSSGEAYKSAMKKWETIQKSGWLPASITSPHQCMAIVQHGASMGMDAWESLQCLQIVQGRPSFHAATLRGLIESRYPGQMQVVECTAERCTIKVKVRDVETGEWTFATETWGESESKKAGLFGKNMHAKYPADMNFARCISRVQKHHLPICKAGDVWITELIEPKAEPQGLGDL